MGAGGGQWQSQHGEDVAHVPSDRLPAGSKPARPLTVVEQLPRRQGHLVPIDSFALDYVQVATGADDLHGHPIESGHHTAEDDAEDLLGALPRFPLLLAHGCWHRESPPRPTRP